jgi:hypothetical protein
MTLGIEIVAVVADVVVVVAVAGVMTMIQITTDRIILHEVSLIKVIHTLLRTNEAHTQATPGIHILPVHKPSPNSKGSGEVHLVVKVGAVVVIVILDLEVEVVILETPTRTSVEEEDGAHEEISRVATMRIMDTDRVAASQMVMDSTEGVESPIRQTTLATINETMTGRLPTIHILPQSTHKNGRV